MKQSITTTDLNQQAPRSPRVRLGGFVHLPRLIDKARANKAGQLGVYIYGPESLLDMTFFEFTGIDPEAFLEYVASGKGDFAILQWVLSQSKTPLLPHQIESWSRWLENLPGLSLEARAWFAEFASSQTPPRSDISTLFEYLDLDDYLRFGGKA